MTDKIYVYTKDPWSYWPLCNLNAPSITWDKHAKKSTQWLSESIVFVCDNFGEHKLNHSVINRCSVVWCVFCMQIAISLMNSTLTCGIIKWYNIGALGEGVCHSLSISQIMCIWLPACHHKGNLSASTNGLSSTNRSIHSIRDHLYPRKWLRFMI